MNPLLRTVLAVVYLAVITVCCVVLADTVLGRARVDLTEDKLYTLSDGTRNIISRIDKPLQMKLYYARTAAMKGPEGLRFFNNYYHYVRELLEEYVERSGGKLSLDVVDPRPFSEEEEQAMRVGLQRIPLGQDEAFFFGLVIESSLGKRKTIPLFDWSRQEFVEYDVSKLIDELITREKSTVGVLSSLPITGMSPFMMQMMARAGREPERPWAIKNALERSFEIQKIESDVDAIEGVDMLFVVHPKDLPEKTLFAVDQFVMNGGKLLVLVDPHCFEDQPEQDPSNPMAAMQYESSSDLNRLLSRWGVEMIEGEIAADRSLGMEVALRPGQPVEKLVTYLELNEDCFNRDTVVAGELHEVRLLYAGALREVAVDGVEVTPLLTTTEVGTTWKPDNPWALRMPQPQQMLQDISDGSEPVMLACEVTGTFPTAFPEGVMVEREGDAGATGDAGGTVTEHVTGLAESTGDPAVIVVADVDFIADRLAYRELMPGFGMMSQVGDNASLVLNSLEFLGGSGDLIAIRSRGRFRRDFDVVAEIEKEEERASADEIEETERKIEDFNEELRTLQSSVSDANRGLMENRVLEKRQKIQEDIREMQKRLRELKSASREHIEELGSWIKQLNMALMPALVLAIGIALAIMRYVRARQYLTRRKP